VRKPEKNLNVAQKCEREALKGGTGYKRGRLEAGLVRRWKSGIKRDRIGPKGFQYSNFVAALELGTRPAILPYFQGE
jgi:hypothetical protein